MFRLDEGTKSRWTVPYVGRPLGLGTVVAELEKQGAVVEVGKFLREKKALRGPVGGLGWRERIPTTAGGVAAAVLVSPVKWVAGTAWSMVRGGDEGEEGDDESFSLKQGDWVIYSLVHRLATAFLEHHYKEAALSSPLSHLLTPEEFVTRLAEVCESEFAFTPSPRDTQLVLTHLSRDVGGVLRSQAGIIKLAPSPHDSASPITEEDKSVLTVTSTLRRLEAQISSLETQITHRNEQIKLALRSNSKSQAASYLRSRKALEELLSRRMAARENLTSVVLKIEQALGDAEVMQSYSQASEALRSVLSRPELKIEHVEEVREGLEEGLARQGEVDEAIRGEGLGEGVEEEEVQEELEALLAEKRREEEGKKEGERKEKEDEKEEDDLLARFERLRAQQAPEQLPTSSAPEAEPPAESSNPSQPEKAVAE